jgi:hypothetical protein
MFAVYAVQKGGGIMGKEFLPVFLDFNETTQDLSDEQCGKLIRALVDYANGKEPQIGDGMLLMAFRFLKGSIDRNARLSAVRAHAGSKGGFAKAEKQKIANDSKNWQNIANDGKSVNINNNSDININSDSNSLLDDEAAADIQHEHDRILTAAEDAGFKMSNTVRARLIALYTDNGMDKMLSGFNECATHGAPTLAYLEAVLKGTGKKKTVVSVLPAQDYHQRDHSNAQEDAFDRMMALAEKDGA